MDGRFAIDVREPPGLPVPQGPMDAAWPGLYEVSLELDADGIARLHTGNQPCMVARHAQISGPLCRPLEVSAHIDNNLSVILHSSADGISLVERVNSELSQRPEVTIKLTDHCVESELLVIRKGRVVLQGDPGKDTKKLLKIPGVHVLGGALDMSGIVLRATRDNKVEQGSLHCDDCVITSSNGCGIECFRKAELRLRDCEITRCSRSGVGVNGKHAQIEMSRCRILLNSYSGLGVNHQACTIMLRDNCISSNGYHGIWLNAGVVAQWHGGEVSGNKLADVAGPGQLRGFCETDG